jgi:hypothetical protein
MDGGDELRSEHIGEIGGNGREAASIHGGNDAKCGNEKVSCSMGEAAPMMPIPADTYIVGHLLILA